jgi:hypothetical protein
MVEESNITGSAPYAFPFRQSKSTDDSPREGYNLGRRHSYHVCQIRNLLQHLHHHARKGAIETGVVIHGLTVVLRVGCTLLHYIFATKLLRRI